jgi:hypothetical protein
MGSYLSQDPRGTAGGDVRLAASRRLSLLCAGRKERQKEPEDCGGKVDLDGDDDDNNGMDDSGMGGFVKAW